MSRGTPDTGLYLRFSCTGLSPSLAGCPKSLPLSYCPSCRSITPQSMLRGLGSSAFARRYLRNRCFFLFLRVLRCFSSPGSLRTAMDSLHGARGMLVRVAPFGDPWITGYVRLPAAFRSLSRPSSALSAKASSLCSS